MARQKAAPPRTRGEKVIAFIEQYLLVPEGIHIGRPLTLRAWQREVILGIYDTPTRRAILSVGRKSGKTALTAMLLLAHLVGPRSRPNSQIFSAAQSRDQASLVFSLAAKMVRMSRTLNELVTVRDSAKELFCIRTGVRYKALSADATTAYGLSPSLTIFDELGQVRGPKSELFEALETATAAQEEPLSLIISTQAPANADLLSVLIDDALTGDDPRVKLWLFTADTSLDPFSEEAIRQANPAFDDFQNATEVLAMAEDARRMPSREAEYRNLILNQRVERTNPFISRAIWEGGSAQPIEDFRGLPVYGGLDLSATSDLTALVLIAPHDGKWHVQPTFWLPEEGLREKARTDRVEYDLWAEKCPVCARDKKSICEHPNKTLSVTPGRSVDFEFVAEHVRGLFDRLDIRQIGFDRWAWVHFKKWLEKVGFGADILETRFVPFGQGYQSMSPALRDLEADLLNHRMIHGDHPLLKMCAANAVVHPDPAGNRKLDKARSRGRIDGMVALAMARGVAATEALEPEPEYGIYLLGGQA